MIYASPPVLSTPTMRDRALTVLVRGFDASLIGEDELLQHMAKVGAVERVKIVVKDGDGRDHGVRCGACGEAATVAATSAAAGTDRAAYYIGGAVRQWARRPAATLCCWAAAEPGDAAAAR